MIIKKEEELLDYLNRLLYVAKYRPLSQIEHERMVEIKLRLREIWTQ